MTQSRIKKLLTDPGVTFETRAKIYDKKRNLIRPRLNIMQRRMRDHVAFCEEHGVPCFILNLKPRQKGSSTFSVWLTYDKCMQGEKVGLVIGGDHSQGDKLMRMMKVYAKEDSMPPGGERAEVLMKFARFPNGSMVDQATAKNGEAGRAGTYQIIIGTEVARWAEEGVANAADILSGALKTCPPVAGSIIILESTARGAAGDYYERWCGAIDADEFQRLVLAGKTKGLPAVRLFSAWYEFSDSAFRLSANEKMEIQESIDAQPWYFGEQDLIDDFGNEGPQGLRLGKAVEDFDVWEQLAWRRWAIAEECQRDPDVFEEDYPSTWERAFRRSGRQAFNRAGLKILARDNATPDYGNFSKARPTDGAGFVKVGLETEAFVWMWEKPRHGCRYLIPLDVMTGSSQTSGKDPDHHGPLVLRAGYFDERGEWVRPRVVCRLAQTIRGEPACRWEHDVLAEQVLMMSEYYGRCIIYVEMDGPGLSVVNYLKDAGGNVAMRRVFDRKEERFTDQLGWRTSVATRPIVISAIEKAIREWDVIGSGIDVPCPWLRKELGTMVVNTNGKIEAAQGKHDDQVMSLGIGLANIEHATVFVHENRPNYLPRDLRGLEEGMGRDATFS